MLRSSKKRWTTSGLGMSPPARYNLGMDHPRERIFPRAYVEGWMRYGIFPPPLHGAHDWPRSVQFMLAVRERELEPPPLTVSDEEAVEIQAARCAATMTQSLSGITPIPGTDLLMIGPDEG